MKAPLEILVTVLAATLIGCSSTQQSAPSLPPGSGQSTTVTPKPKPLTYTIVSDNADSKDPDWDIDVLLNRRATVNELEALAEKIRKENLLALTTKKRTFMHFRVEGEPHSAAWAQAYFTPEPEVKIIGMTRQQEESIVRPEGQAWAGGFGRMDL